MLHAIQENIPPGYVRMCDLVEGDRVIWQNQICTVIVLTTAKFYDGKQNATLPSFGFIPLDDPSKRFALKPTCIDSIIRLFRARHPDDAPIPEEFRHR